MERFKIIRSLVVVTPNDFMRLRSNYHRLVRWLPSKRIVFICNEEVRCLASELGESLNVSLVDVEGDKINFV